jgi:hypothetical protein
MATFALFEVDVFLLALVGMNDGNTWSQTTSDKTKRTTLDSSLTFLSLFYI